MKKKTKLQLCESPPIISWQSGKCRNSLDCFGKPVRRSFFHLLVQAVVRFQRIVCTPPGIVVIIWRKHELRQIPNNGNTTKIYV